VTGYRNELMPTAPPTVVKLGGAVITRKHRDGEVRSKVLTRLVREVTEGPIPLVLLHGAGSFGHPAAKKFGLSLPPDPLVPPETRARGAAIVSADVRRLHLEVLTALVRAGARPWSVPPAGLVTNQEGKLVSLDPRPFREALDRGLLPVSFGDVVPDNSWGFSILSADRIAVELVRALSARRVVFVSEVEGIYESMAPGRRKVVELVTPDLPRKLGRATAGADVTGGIQGKAEAMVEISRLGAVAGLISGLKDGALSRALRGETVYGSWTHAAPG